MPRRKIVNQALFVALAGLLPVPFVDMWVQSRLRAELISQLGRHYERPFDPAQVKVLARGHGNLLLGCLVGAVWWPIKKLFRKVIYILTVKDAVDAAAEAWLRGEMVRRGLEARALPARAKDVRTAMDAALKAHARSPLWGPRTKVAGELAESEDTVFMRLIEGLAQRSGGLAVLADFDERLAEICGGLEE